MQNPVSPMENNQPFCFSCSPQVACFNRCCHDLNQVLTPCDVLCLSRFMAIPSGEFLGRYTEESTGPGTGLPVVSLRFSDSAERACPFVTDAGCRVYPARPASCRTYPLARGVSRNRQTGRLTEHWAVIQEAHCLGFKNGQPRTVDQWVAEQQLAIHHHMNDKMLELISQKNRLRPGPLMPSESKRVYTALYDLDRFRYERFGKDRPPAATADTQVLGRVQPGDLDLLVFAMEWVVKNGFNGSTEKARE